MNDAAAAVAGGAFYILGGTSVRGGATDAVQRYVEIDCATPSPTATRPPGPSPTRTGPVSSTCVGDCDGDGRVVVADLVKGVNIALERQPLEGCSTFDDNEDGRVSVNELVAAVGFALGGCPPS